MSAEKPPFQLLLKRIHYKTCEFFVSELSVSELLVNFLSCKYFLVFPLNKYI
jgi:hypothetical protein